ncbi:MAG TPA: gamma-aminobutyraldehyde dehydrogenase [Thermoleophilaceae bacterium]|nr:gamma-aminobutyraldehyde dehydrogenase [Thermoleophilaceae bacterium]
MPEPRELRNHVNGELKAPREGETLDIVNPSTGEVYATSPRSGAGDVDDAMQAAQTAFDEVWRDTTPSERMAALLKMADAIEDNAERLVEIESENTGKPKGLTLSEEIPPMCDQIRFFAGAARMLEGRATAEYMSGFTSSIRREPIGVIGAVAPWNYPMMMGVWKFAPALAAGNTMVLKPSDTTPASSLYMAELFADILPPGVFNVVCGDRDTGATVVSHPIPQMVSITGSIAAGKAVARAAADTLKRCHLELGGKAPVIVFDDADLEGAAEDIAVAGYFNAGQDCTAATRVLASERVGGDLAAALVEQAGQVRLSKDEEPGSEDFFIPPINNANQLGRVSGLVDRAPAHAHVLAGGERVTGDGYFYAPTVIDGLEQDDEMAREEIFGPVITVQPFTDEDEALRWANGTKYGLASSVWTSNHKRALRISRRLDFGCVWVNCHIPLVAEMPHGGFKESGYGKDLSSYSFEEYTRVKHVMSAIEG